ncbi:hypothetical protein Fmac_012898 [Flemingia macrophylla]|uniref:SAM domain-containing protein n=1 Tax=Flemingia macrophylla TaxID=520843 RepID=A0ABD1MRL5_9FABA
MDWFSWLSKTTLEPSLIYEYGLTFARNELQVEDACFFNHEFLQSMGISIAKHRLEILKLVKKEEGASSRPNKKLSGVIKKCLRKCMDKFVSREDHKNMFPPMPLTSVSVPPREINWYEAKQVKGSLVRKQQVSEDALKEDKPLPVPPMYRSKTIALSGPLDSGRMHMQHEKMVNNRALKLSGPLDGRMHERMMSLNRSPLMSRPIIATAKSPRISASLDANRSPRLPTRAETQSPMGCSPYNKPKGDFDLDDDHTLWPSLFQDLKPT